MRDVLDVGVLVLLAGYLAAGDGLLYRGSFDVILISKCTYIYTNVYIHIRTSPPYIFIITYIHSCMVTYIYVYKSHKYKAGVEFGFVN